MCTEIVYPSTLCFFSTWGRVWVHHLSSGHHQNSDGQWLSCPVPWSIKTVNSVYPEFIMIHSFAFIYICQQIEKNWVSHHWNSDGSVAASAHCCSSGGLNSSSGRGLKLYLGCTGSTPRSCSETPGLTCSYLRTPGNNKAHSTWLVLRTGLLWLSWITQNAYPNEDRIASDKFNWLL